MKGLKAYTTEDGRIVTVPPGPECRTGWQIQRNGWRCRYFRKNVLLRQCVKVVEANAAYVPPYGSGATLYIRPYMFGI